MGLRSRLKKASNIVAAPAVGAYKGLVATGAAPAAKTVKGALRGDKSDLALVGVTAVSVVPAARLARGAQIASRARGLSFTERASVAGRVAVTNNPVFHGTTSGAASSIYSEGFKTAQGISYAAKDIKAAANYARTASRLEGGKPAIVVGKMRPGAQGRTIGLGGVGMNDADIIPTPSVKTAMGILGGSALRNARRTLASERGALSPTQYMKGIRFRYENARTNPGALQATNKLAARAAKAADRTPDGMIFEATTAKIAGSKSRTAYTDTTTMNLSRMAAGSQREKSLVAALAVDVRMMRGKKQPLMKGFYEKLQDESGVLKFPDKEDNVIRRVKNKVMKTLNEAGTGRIMGEAMGRQFARAQVGADLGENAAAASPRGSYHSIEGFLESKGKTAQGKARVKRVSDRLRIRPIK